MGSLIRYGSMEGKKWKNRFGILCKGMESEGWPEEWCLRVVFTSDEISPMNIGCLTSAQLWAQRCVYSVFNVKEDDGRNRRK